MSLFRDVLACLVLVSARHRVEKTCYAYKPRCSSSMIRIPMTEFRIADVHAREVAKMREVLNETSQTNMKPPYLWARSAKGNARMVKQVSVV